MSSRSLTIEQILTLLAAAPTRLIALTSGLAPAQLRSSPAPDEWSTNDVLAHLRACADVWGNSIATIIAEDKPTIRAVNPRAWINKDGLSRSGLPALAARLCHATRRTAGRPGTVAARRLVTYGDRDRSGEVLLF